jgi:hypothetical protein
MGVSIWYCPPGNDRAVKIDLGSNLTDLDPQPDDLVLGAESLGGAASRAMFRSRLRVRVELARFTSNSLERDLLTFQTHVNLGGSFALALVESKAWAGYTPVKPARATVLGTRGNTWSFGQSASLAAGDVVCVWGGTPEGFREYTTVSAFASGQIVTLTDGLRYGYKQGPMLVRHRDYYPALRRLKDDTSPLVTHERRMVFTFAGEFVEDTAMLAEAASWSPGVLPTTTGNNRGLSPDVLFPGVPTAGSGMAQGRNTK